MKRLYLPLAMVALLMVASFASVSAQDDTATVNLQEVEGSGVSGTATLTAQDGQTMVSIEIQGGMEGGVHPVHIHTGTCENLGSVEYPLENIEGGTSETTVDVALSELQSGEYAINAHLSEEEISTFIACGNIPSGTDDGSGDVGQVPPATGSSGSDSSGITAVLVTLVGGAILTTGLMVRRRLRAS